MRVRNEYCLVKCVLKRKKAQEASLTVIVHLDPYIRGRRRSSLHAAISGRKHPRNLSEYRSKISHYTPHERLHVSQLEHESSRSTNARGTQGYSSHPVNRAISSGQKLKEFSRGLTAGSGNIWDSLRWKELRLCQWKNGRGQKRVVVSAWAHKMPK
ncbi:uncharacterized protein BT62DRAFT_478107 [Guyanagaster necrorhizus]|uniref:Uncharacterized protein n=1 Tax=Guyanagaster necrorhizus TaxID=856835 RepID=A0A9P7VJF0_9AGAR|nr:uncharacterized protein BT62DRAFT_478107 [Guyanagaster necrorhizus MCA 3950]KAG7441653.1 hypothetical protein BT62DRAFT_478107 [Guyanagaster necrorhizus MCA 3950]